MPVMNLPPLHSLRLCEPSCARRAASTGTGIDTLPKGLECSICLMDLNKTAEDGLDVPPGAEKPWVFACKNHHVFHKLCLLNQFQAGDTRCTDCREPLTWPQVAPPAAAAAAPPVLAPPVLAAPAPAAALPETRLRTAVERRDVPGMTEALNLGARARMPPGEQRGLMFMVVRDSTATATTAARMVRTLLNAGFPANGYDGHNTLTGYAASRGWGDAVGHLLDHGGALLPNTYITPLAWAVDSAKSNVVRLLLRMGAHWNALTEATKLRMTPQRTVFQLQREFRFAGGNTYLLQLAARADSRHHVLEALLEAWGEYNRNLPGGHDDPGAISFESVRGDRAFVEACARGKVQNAKTIMVSVALYRDDYSDLPLHEGLRAAIEKNRVQVVELFLSDRDDVFHVAPDYALNATFRTGALGMETMSPLIFAMVREKFTIAQLLLNGGADVNAARVWPSGAKATVLHVAVVSVLNHGAQVADGALPEMNLLRSILSKRPDPTPIVAIEHPNREPRTVLQAVEEWNRIQDEVDSPVYRIRGLLVSTYPEWYDADGTTLLAQERNVAIAPRDPRAAAAAGRRDEDDDRDRDRGAPSLGRERSRSRDRM